MTTACFTPRPLVTLPQAASPLMFALVTRSSAVKSPVFTEPMGQGSSESKVLLVPAQCTQQEERGGITSEITPRDIVQSEGKADAYTGSLRQIGFN